MCHVFLSMYVSIDNVMFVFMYVVGFEAKFKPLTRAVHIEI